MCRAAPTEKEALNLPQEDEEEDEGDDEYENEEDRRSLQIPMFNSEAAQTRAQEEALWVMRTTFERLENDTLLEPEPLPTKVDLSWHVYEVTSIGGREQERRYLEIDYYENTEENRRHRHSRGCNRSRNDFARGGYESS